MCKKYKSISFVLHDIFSSYLRILLSIFSPPGPTCHFLAFIISYIDYAICILAYISSLLKMLSTRSKSGSDSSLGYRDSPTFGDKNTYNSPTLWCRIERQGDGEEVVVAKWKRSGGDAYFIGREKPLYNYHRTVCG